MSYGPRQRKPRNHSLSFRSWFDDQEDSENPEFDDQNSGAEPPDAGTTASAAAKSGRYDPFAEPAAAAANREPRRPKTGLSLNQPDWAPESEAGTAPESPRHRQPFAGGAMRATARPTAPEKKPGSSAAARLAEEFDALLKPAAKPEAPQPKAPVAAPRPTARPERSAHQPVLPHEPTPAPRPSPHPEAVPHQPAAEDRPPAKDGFLSGPRGPSHQSRIRPPRSMPGAPAAPEPDAPLPEQPDNRLDRALNRKIFPTLSPKAEPTEEPPLRHQNLPYRIPDHPIDAEQGPENAVFRLDNREPAYLIGSRGILKEIQPYDFRAREERETTEGAPPARPESDAEAGPTPAAGTEARSRTERRQIGADQEDSAITAFMLEREAVIEGAVEEQPAIGPSGEALRADLTNDFFAALNAYRSGDGVAFGRRNPEAARRFEGFIASHFASQTLFGVPVAPGPASPTAPFPQDLYSTNGVADLIRALPQASINETAEAFQYSIDSEVSHADAERQHALDNRLFPVEQTAEQIHEEQKSFLTSEMKARRSAIDQLIAFGDSGLLDEAEARALENDVTAWISRNAWSPDVAERAAHLSGERDSDRRSNEIQALLGALNDEDRVDIAAFSLERHLRRRADDAALAGVGVAHRQFRQNVGDGLAQVAHMLDASWNGRWETVDTPDGTKRVMTRSPLEATGDLLQAFGEGAVEGLVGIPNIPKRVRDEILAQQETVKRIDAYRQAIAAGAGDDLTMRWLEAAHALQTLKTAGAVLEGVGAASGAKAIQGAMQHAARTGTLIQAGDANAILTAAVAAELRENVGKLHAFPFPAFKRLRVQWEEIQSKHTSAGRKYQQSAKTARRGGQDESDKTLFPETMGPRQIQRSIRQAYRRRKLVGRQTHDNKTILEFAGVDDQGLQITLHVDLETMTLESAYPKMR